jgi:hypothetical protein
VNDEADEFVATPIPGREGQLAVNWQAQLRAADGVIVTGAHGRFLHLRATEATAAALRVQFGQVLRIERAMPRGTAGD